MAYTWRKWRAGLLMVILLSLAVAGSTLAGGWNWKAFVAAFCASLITHMERYLKEFPIESIQETIKTSAKLLAVCLTIAWLCGCTTVVYTRTDAAGETVQFRATSLGTKKAFDTASLNVSTNSKAFSLSGYENDQTDVLMNGLDALKSGFEAMKAAQANTLKEIDAMITLTRDQTKLCASQLFRGHSAGPIEATAWMTGEAAASFHFEQSLELGGRKYEPDEFNAFLEFSCGHAFPVVSSYASAFSAATLANSHATMGLKVFDWRHMIASYYRHLPQEERPRHDRVLGTILGVELPRTPSGGWRLTTMDDAPGIRGVAVIHKQLQGVDQIIGKHQSGRTEWVVSLEVNFQYIESGVVLVPTGEEKALPKSVNLQTPDDFSRAGFEYMDLVDAPAELFEAWDSDAGMFVRRYRGWQPVALLGGLDGNVFFKGVGLVEFGAEPTARVDQLIAEDPFAAARQSVRELANSFEEIRKNIANHSA